MLKSHGHTLAACYLGYVTQAISNNFAPLLFVIFQKQLGIDLGKITLLITINFCVQLAVDLLCVKFVDKIGYRAAAVTGHVFAAAGLVGLGFFPTVFGDAFSALAVAVTLYAIGGGLIEVVVSPIAEACPTVDKSASMSLLHSFYCWGSVLVIAASTLFLKFAGGLKWNLLAYFWAAVPLAGALYFAMVPVYELKEETRKTPLKKMFSSKTFWIFAVMMFAAGASELAMGQWASAFAESGLGVSKAAGDLAGPCLFAALMGAVRLLYAKFGKKLDLTKCLAVSGALCLSGLLLAAFAPAPWLGLAGCALCGAASGLLWPGTISLSAKYCAGGTSMFALLALAGDIGCAAGPALVGLISDAAGGLRQGLSVAVVFPAVLIVFTLLFKKYAIKSELMNPTKNDSEPFKKE